MTHSDQWIPEYRIHWILNTWSSWWIEYLLNTEYKFVLQYWILNTIFLWRMNNVLNTAYHNFTVVEYWIEYWIQQMRENWILNWVANIRLSDIWILSWILNTRRLSELYWVEYLHGIQYSTQYSVNTTISANLTKLHSTCYSLPGWFWCGFWWFSDKKFASINNSLMKISALTIQYTYCQLSAYHIYLKELIIKIFHHKQGFTVSKNSEIGAVVPINLQKLFSKFMPSANHVAS